MRRTILAVVMTVLAVMVLPGLGIGVPSGGRIGMLWEATTGPS